MAKGLKLLPAALMTTVLLAVLQAPGYSQTASRRLYVSATNQWDVPVLDLGTAEFEIREAGEKSDISRIALIHRPMRIALLVDTSVSAARVVPQIHAALRAFFDELDPQHEIVLITTGDQLQVRVPPTTDRERLKAQSDLLFADGGNVLLSAIFESYNRFLRSGDYHPILLVMTVSGPGSQTWPKDQELDRLGKAMRSNGGAVHGLVMNLPGLVGGCSSSEFMGRICDGDHGVDICATLAKATDGLSMDMLTAAPLAEAAGIIARRINQDYRLSPLIYEIEYTGVGKGVTPQIQVTRPGVRVEMLSSR
jgi:hypothetical protein